MIEQIAAADARKILVNLTVEKIIRGMTPGEIVKVALDWLLFLEGQGLHVKRRRRGNLVDVARAALKGKIAHELRTGKGIENDK